MDPEVKPEEKEKATRTDPFNDIPTTNVGESLDSYANELKTPLQAYQSSGGDDTDIENDPDFVEHKGAGSIAATGADTDTDEDDDGIKPAPTEPDQQKKDRRWRLAVKITSLANRLFPGMIGWMHDEPATNFKADADDQRELSIAHYELLQPYEEELKDAYGPIFTYIMVWGIDWVAGIPNAIRKLIGKAKNKNNAAPQKRQMVEPEIEGELQPPPRMPQPARPVKAEQLDQKRENRELQRRLAEAEEAKRVLEEQLKRPQETDPPTEQNAPTETTPPTAAEETAPNVDNPEGTETATSQATDTPNTEQRQQPDAATMAQIEDLGDRIASNSFEEWSAADLQLQANYPKELEQYLQRYQMSLEDSPLTIDLENMGDDDNVRVCKCGCGAKINEGRHFINKKHYGSYTKKMAKNAKVDHYNEFVLWKTPDGRQFKEFKFNQKESEETTA